MNRKKVTYLLILALLSLATATSVWAASVTPIVIPGASNTDKTCAVVMPGTTEFKIEPVPDGTNDPYSDGTLSVEITKPSTLAGSSNSFDWTSNIVVEGVIVKGGSQGANWYDYRPSGSTGDTYLTTPNNGSQGISHISFCYYPPRDWGDLPEPLYPTLSASNGPRHVIGDLYLGACIDAEADGQPNAAATGDDTGASGYTVGTCATVNDDEDGVTPVGPWKNGVDGGEVTVTANGDGHLCAWFDFGSASGSAPDGIFDTFVSQPVSAGGQSVAFDIPAGTFESGSEFVTVYARFRLFEDDPGCSLASGFTGEATNGEVEDYRFEFRPTAVSLQSVVAQTTSGDGLWILVSLALLVGMGTFALLRRRQAHA